MGRIYYVAAPTKGRSVLVCQSDSGLKLWSNGKASDAPNVKTAKGSNEAAVVKALQAAAKAIPTKAAKGATDLKGQWKGYLEVTTRSVEVVLYRDLTGYGRLAVVGKPGKGWTSAAGLTNKKWYTARGKAQNVKGGTSPSFKKAAMDGYAAIAKIVTASCVPQSVMKSPARKAAERKARTNKKTGKPRVSIATARKTRSDKVRTAAIALKKRKAAAKKNEAPASVKNRVGQWVVVLKGKDKDFVGKIEKVAKVKGKWVWRVRKVGTKGVYRSVVPSKGIVRKLKDAAAAQKKAKPAKKAPAKANGNGKAKPKPAAAKPKAGRKVWVKSGNRRKQIAASTKTWTKKGSRYEAGKPISFTKIGGTVKIKTKNGYSQVTRIAAASAKKAAASSKPAPPVSPAAQKYETQYRKYLAGDGRFPKSRGRKGLTQAEMEAIRGRVDAEREASSKPAATEATVYVAPGAGPGASGTRKNPTVTQKRLVGSYISFRDGKKLKHGQVQAVEPNSKGNYNKANGGAKLLVAVAQDGMSIVTMPQFRAGEQTFTRSRESVFANAAALHQRLVARKGVDPTPAAAPKPRPAPKPSSAFADIFAQAASL